MVADLAFSRQFAFAVLRNQLKRTVFASGICWSGRTGNCQAGYVDQPLKRGRVSVCGINQIAGPALINLVIFRVTAGLGAAGAMYYVSNTLQRSNQAGRLQNRPRPPLYAVEVTAYKTCIAGRSKKDGARDCARVEGIEDVTADKSGSACDQNFQSGQAEFLANFTKFV